MITPSNLAEQLREYQLRSKHDWASVSPSSPPLPISLPRGASSKMLNAEFLYSHKKFLSYVLFHGFNYYISMSLRKKILMGLREKKGFLPLLAARDYYVPVFIYLLASAIYSLIVIHSHGLYTHRGNGGRSDDELDFSQRCTFHPAGGSE